MSDAPGPIDEFSDSLKKNGVSVALLRPGAPEEVAVSSWLESSFPFSAWGRIDWDEVSEKSTLDWKDGKALLKAFDVLRHQHDAVRQTGREDIVHVISSNAADPIMAFIWWDLLANFESVIHADSDLWIVCKGRNWCIEKTRFGTLGCGISRQSNDAS